MVPSHVADPTVIVAGRVVKIRGEWRRSCGGLSESAAGTGAVVALFMSGTSSGVAAASAIGSGSISMGAREVTGRRRIIRRGPCIGADKSKVPSSRRTSLYNSMRSMDGGEVAGDAADHPISDSSSSTSTSVGGARGKRAGASAEMEEGPTARVLTISDAHGRPSANRSVRNSGESE